MLIVAKKSAAHCGVAVAANIRKTDVKKLLTGIVALTIAGCAAAQASETYDPYGRLTARITVTGNSGAAYTPDGRLLHRHTKRGNVTKTYDNSGRLLNIGIKRGNVQFLYSPNGRLMGRGYYDTGRLYDVNGRLLGVVR